MISQVKIPKFKLEKEYDLKNLLKKLGLTDMFAISADLSNMSKKPLTVGSGVHKAFLEVNFTVN